MKTIGYLTDDQTHSDFKIACAKRGEKIKKVLHRFVKNYIEQVDLNEKNDDDWGD